MILLEMSARTISIPPSQGQALYPQSGRQNPQTRAETLSLKLAGEFSCGRLTVNQPRCQLSERPADYREPPHGLGFETILGEGIASSTSYAQSSDVRVPVNGSSLQGMGNSATRDPATRDPSQGVASPSTKDSFQGVGSQATRDLSRDLSRVDVAARTTKDVVDEAVGLNNAALDCYVPVPGDRVLGVVVSGNNGMLDVDIGAAKLGHLHVQDLLPRYEFDVFERKYVLPADATIGRSSGTPSLGLAQVVYDEQVYCYGPPLPLVVDVGSVLELEVVELTANGNPLLSARKAAQRLQWSRVLQIKARNEPFQVKILNFNKAGVTTTVEGLRAFLPLAEFVKYPNAAKGESYENYVGRTLWVTIPYVREITGNITLSEKDVWIKRNLKLGTVVNGTVTKCYGFGVLVQVNETDIWGMIHVSNIANALIKQVSDVFELGEQIKVMVVKSPVPGRLAFSTALLESERGLMIRDKQRVFREAEQTAIAVREKHPEWEESIDDVAEDNAEDDAEDDPFAQPISNLEWIDFQRRT